MAYFHIVNVGRSAKADWQSVEELSLQRIDNSRQHDRDKREMRRALAVKQGRRPA